MAAALLRRSVATAGVAVLATLASPLVGAALADAPTLAAPTFTPADGATVQATRPLISADYGTALNKSATQIAVIDTTASNRVVSCTPAFNTDATSVGCTLNENLVDGDVYSVRVHAVNAANSADARNDQASWTIDIPSITVSSPADGDTVAVAQGLSATYDEAIDSTHSKAVLVNGFGTKVPGSVSVAKSSVNGACPTAACILKFNASQTLPAGSYTLTLDAFGLTGSPQAAYDANDYAHNVIHFTVDKTVPTVAPQAGPDDPYIWQGNVSKVPFSGYALPGFNVGVAIYDQSCDDNCDFPFADDPGTGLQDGFGHTFVDQCTDDVAHITGDGKRLCPFALTVDDSNGCDTGSNEFSCGNNGDPTADVKNQWYAYSYSAAGQFPHASSGDPEIERDTTAPAAPDNSAHGFLTNNSPSAGDAQLQIAASDLQETPADYVVKITDSVGNSHSWSIPPNGSNNLNTQIDITPDDGLADGALTVGVGAADDKGNVSSFVSAHADPGKSFSKEVVQLAPADPATHVDSMKGANGTTFDLATLGASDKAGVPAKITVHFNEPITLSISDPTGSGVPTGHLCLLDPGGVCTTAGIGTLTNPSSDRTELDWTAPNGFGADLTDGVYSIAAFAPAATCPTRTSPVSYSCETSGGSENDPTSWQVLGTFTIDKAAPVIQTLSVSPALITPLSVNSVTIAGSSDPDTRVVRISITSSAGGAPLVISQDVAAPADPSATKVDWSFFPVNMANVRDGKVTISAIGIDDAGNATPNPGKQVTATLRAHASGLTAKVSSTKVTYGQYELISGRLTDQAGHAINKAIVTVKERFDNGKMSAGRQAKTDSKGHWQMLWAPSQNGRFVASYAGSTTAPLHDAVSASTSRTLVRVAIRFTSPNNHASVGSPVTLRGVVSPNKRGRTVSIYRHTSTGNKFVGKATLNRFSQWTFKLTLPKGTTRLIAAIGATPGNLGNQTTILTITH